MKEPLHVCVDYDLSQHQVHDSLRHAIQENPKNNPALKGTPEHAAIRKIIETPRAILTPDEASHVQRMALVTGKMWGSGRAVTICFLDGSAIQKK